MNSNFYPIGFKGNNNSFAAYYFYLLLLWAMPTVSIGQIPTLFNEASPCGFEQVYTEITDSPLGSDQLTSIQETAAGFQFKRQINNRNNTFTLLEVQISKEGVLLNQNRRETTEPIKSYIKQDTVVFVTSPTTQVTAGEVKELLLREVDLPITSVDSISSVGFSDLIKVGDSYLITGSYGLIPRIRPTTQPDARNFILKVDSMGTIENLRAFSFEPVIGNFIYTADASDAIYLGYQTFGRTGHIFKVTPEGEIAWDISIIGDLVSNSIERVRLSLDGKSLYVAGYDDPKAFVRKYDATTGELLWDVAPGELFSMDGDFTVQERVQDIVLTADSSIVIGYPYRSTNGNGSGYEYGKLDAAGNPLWWKRIPETPVDYRGLQPIIETTDGSLLFAGLVGDFFSVIKTTATGDLEPKCDPLNTPTCAAEILTLNSQAEVDAFGFCTVFDGNIAVAGGDITNLDGLSGLTEITGSFFIRASATSLQNIAGLSALRTIGGGIEIIGSPTSALTNLDGFSSLTSVGNRIFISGTQLQNVEGLSRVTRIAATTTTIGGNPIELRASVQFVGNEQLETINIASMSSIEGDLTIAGNAKLSTIRFSIFLTIADQLTIANNVELKDIISTENLLSRLGQDTSQNQVLTLTNNPKLAACCFLQTDTNPLEDSPRINISNNASSCDSPAAIRTACLTRCSGDITFSLQSELDVFLPCTRFDGSITITGSDINDLDALRLIREITGNLTLNTSLTEIDDLFSFFNLKKIGGTLTILNPGITRLGGLNGLTEVGSILLEGTAVDRLNGFTALETINNNLTINNNAALEGFGFFSLKNIGGNLAITGNSSLTELDGLDQLSTIGGSLFLIGNDALSNIEDLKNIQSIGTTTNNRIEISDNPSLSDCCVLQELVNNTTTNQIIIKDNGTNCASMEAINVFCTNPDTSKTDLALSINTTNPNPAIYSHLPVTVTIENTSNVDATDIKVTLIVCGDRSPGFQSVSQLVYANTESTTTAGTYDYLLQEWTLPNLAANSTASLTVNLFTLTAEELNVIAYVDSASPADQDSTPDPIQFDRDCSVDEDDEALLALNRIFLCDCPEDESMPVCGSDGYTYSSACKADCLGISWEAGACDVPSGETTCGAINITYGTGTIEIIGERGEDYFFKVHRRQPTWEYVFECNGKCGFGQTVRDLSGGTYYIDVYDKSWHLICDDIEVVLRSELQSTVIQRSSSLSTTTTNQANPQAIKTPIAIYPNPAKDQLTLQYVPNAAATVSILLASGQIMSTQQLAIGTARHAIDLQDLPEGLYLLKIEESQQVPTTKRFIKIR